MNKMMVNMDIDKFWLLCILVIIIMDIQAKNWLSVIAWTACVALLVDGIRKDTKIRNTIKSLDDLKQTVKEMRK